DEDRARHSLAQTVYALKRACDADPVEGSTGLRLDEAVVSADVLDFERAIAACATRAGEVGDHHRAADWWRRAAAIDPLDSRVALALVQSLAAAGETAAAIKQADLYQQIRRTELDLEPDAAVAGLAQRLRSQPFGIAPASPPPMPAAPND